MQSAETFLAASSAASTIVVTSGQKSARDRTHLKVLKHQREHIPSLRLIAPETMGLEDEFPFGKAYFQVLYQSPEGLFQLSTPHF